MTDTHTLHGKTGTLRDWAAWYGMNYPTLRSRISRGLTLSEALTKPMRYTGREMKKSGNPPVPKRRPQKKVKRQWHMPGPIVNGKYWNGYRYVMSHEETHTCRKARK